MEADSGEWIKIRQNLFNSLMEKSKTKSLDDRSRILRLLDTLPVDQGGYGDKTDLSKKDE